MTMGVLGRKCGMTRIFTEEGASVPVTVIEVAANRVSQLKTQAADGYQAVQVAVGTRRISRVSKAQAGHFSKAGIPAAGALVEFRHATDAYQLGDEIKIDMFSVGQRVDVSGTSKGKGYAGTIKRWNFRGQDNSHGNSLSHRVPGSIGQCQTPGRVFKGKKMSGHLGDKRVTVQSLEVIRVDLERNLLLVKGAVPGCVGSDLVVLPAAKTLV